HRVQDCLLRGLDHGAVVRTDLAVGEHAQRELALAGTKPAVSGREREEEVAARMRGGAAHAGDAEADSLRQAVALVRQERRVRRGDADDRAPLLPRLRNGNALADELADRSAVDAEAATPSVVRLHQDADD